jgi:hypothetical protein
MSSNFFPEIVALCITMMFYPDETNIHFLLYIRTFCLTDTFCAAVTFCPDILKHPFFNKPVILCPADTFCLDMTV